jgi:hypothetical protein
MSRRAHGTARPLRVSQDRCPQDPRRARAAARAPSPLAPNTHRDRTEVDTEAFVANEQRRDSRAGTGHDMATESVDEPMSNERIRQGTERMPTSGTMPKSQVSARELSELSRIETK